MLIQFNQFSLDELQRQNLVYLTRIIPTAINMTFKYLFHRMRTKVRSLQRERIKQYLLQVGRQFIAVPDTEVSDFVPPKEQLFEAKRSKDVIESCQPLRHSVIIGILRFKGELLVPMQRPCDTGD